MHLLKYHTDIFSEKNQKIKSVCLRNEVDGMHILAFILLFIIGSIQAACHGDWSGIGAIGKIVGFIALFLIVGYIMINPVLLIIAVVVFIIILIVCCSK